MRFARRQYVAYGIMIGRMSLDNGTGRNITARLAQIFHITRTGARRRFGSKDTRARHEAADHRGKAAIIFRSEEHTSELQSLMRISYAVFCLKKKKKNINNIQINIS